MANDSKPFLPGRGRRSISDAPGGNYGEKWHQQLEQLEKPKRKDKPKEVRLVGGVFTLNQHYVKFAKKGGGTTGYYEICLNFDPITGEFRTGEEAVCPICKYFTDQDLPEDLRMYGTFRYYVDAFDMERVRAGVQDGAFGVLWTNKYGKNDWVKITSTLGNELDDLEHGCTIHWFYDENAKDNKEKMSFAKGDRLRVEFSEKHGLYGIRVSPNKVITGAPTDFETIVQVGMKKPSEIERDLTRLQLFKKLSEFTSATSGGFFSDGGGSKDRRSEGRNSAPPPPQDAPRAPDENLPVEEPRGGRDFRSAPSTDADWGGGAPAGADDGWGGGATAAPAAPAPDNRPKGNGGARKPAAAAPAAPPADDGWGGTVSNPGKSASKPTSAPDEDFSAFGGGFGEPEPPASGGPAGGSSDDGW